MRAEPDDASEQVTQALGDGRVLHATAREGVNAVVEEPLENVDARPIRFVRLAR